MNVKRAGIVSICLLVFLFFTAGCQTLEEADINRGYRWHYRGDYQRATRTFEGVLKHNPQSAEAYMGLAMTWEDAGDYDKAKEYFSKAVSLDRRAAFFYDVGSNNIESVAIRRGWRHRSWAEHNQAMTSFNLALEKNPQSAEAYIGLAMLSEDKKHYDKAIEYFSKAIEIEPRAGYFFLRGEVWGKKKNFEQAIEDYTSAIRTDPTFAGNYIDRADCYIEIGELEAAVEDYNKVLELAPEDKKTAKARAEILEILSKVAQFDP